MNIREALWILDRCHTRDDDYLGYTVESMPYIFDFDSVDYINAWGVLRSYLRSADGTHRAADEDVTDDAHDGEDRR